MQTDAEPVVYGSVCWSPGSLRSSSPCVRGRPPTRIHVIGASGRCGLYYVLQAPQCQFIAGYIDPRPHDDRAISSVYSSPFRQPTDATSPSAAPSLPFSYMGPIGSLSGSVPSLAKPASGFERYLGYSASSAVPVDERCL